MADSTIGDLASQAFLNSDDVFAIEDNAGVNNFKVTAAVVQRGAYDNFTATDSISLMPNHFITLNGAGAIALTITGAPVAGDEIEVIRDGTGVVTHTVVLSGSVTWDGTNKTANFDTDNDTIRAKAISATRWRILGNTGVTFTA